MIESVITFLIYVCVLAILVYLVIYVLGVIGIAIPPKVVQLLWVIVILIVILMAFRILLPGLATGHGRWGWGGLLPMLT